MSSARDKHYKRKVLIGKKNDDFPDCVYCETPFFYLNGELDHIEPISKGGSRRSYNEIVVCKSCNRSKRNKQLVYWLIQKSIAPESVYERLKAQNKSIPIHMLNYLRVTT